MSEPLQWNEIVTISSAKMDGTIPLENLEGVVVGFSDDKSEVAVFITTLGRVWCLAVAEISGTGRIALPEHIQPPTSIQQRLARQLNKGKPHQGSTGA